jgi:hypothetical protein
MQIIDMTKERKKALEFTPIAMPDVDEDKLYEVLEGAENALERYTKMYELVKQADALSDDIPLGTWFSDFMSEECSVPDYEDSAVDVIEGLKKHLRLQVARFEQFVDDIEAEIEDCVEQRLEDKKYGTYEEQVRWTYRHSVL